MKSLVKTITRPARSLAGRFLRDVFGQVSTPDGYNFKVYPTMHPMDCLALRTGRYERAETAILRGHFQPDDTIIEIGSNIGVVASVAFSEKLNDGGTLVCVEPNPDALPALAFNIAALRPRFPARNAVIIAAAVDAPGAETGTAEFRIRPNLGSGLAAVTAPRSNERVTDVAATSLSALVKRYAPNGASLICDAEGGEIPMILEDREGLRHIRQMAIELHEPGLTGRRETPEIMLDHLKSQGFSVGARNLNTWYLTRASL